MEHSPAPREITSRFEKLLAELVRQLDEHLRADDSFPFCAGLGNQLPGLCLPSRVRGVGAIDEDVGVEKGTHHAYSVPWALS